MITEEMEHVSMYIKIQQLRRPEHVFYRFSMAEDCRLCLLPPLILQTFVENSFKYGSDLSGKLSIDISARKDGNGTEVVIRDQGPGFPKSVLEDIRLSRATVQGQRECVGILNACERLKLFLADIKIFL